MKYNISIDPRVILPRYQHLLNDDDVDIDFLYGSRDSSKSHTTAQLLILKCLSEKYFRCVLVRKVYATIKDSQFQLIKDIVTDWGLERMFTFNVSPLEIKCINGNRFICRGFDDPQKIKSIQNPNYCFIEEASELTADDFIVLTTSLRTNQGRTKIFATFNPEAQGDYRDFWLYKDFFSHTDLLSFKNTKVIQVGEAEIKIVYRATHSTYKDNPYCSPQRIAIYESLRDTSPYYYKIYCLGLWQNRENKSPFILTFNREKHLGETVYNHAMPLYLSFDFNRNPMCCNVIQWDNANVVNVIEVIKLPNSSTWQVCELIKMKYETATHTPLYIVCGDYSGVGQSAMVREDDLNNHYKIIMQVLNLTHNQLQYILNPPIEKNQVLCNWAFQNLAITINPDTCQPLIFDIENAEMLADGSLKKRDRNDPSQQLDALDGFRYFINRYFRDIKTGIE